MLAWFEERWPLIAAYLERLGPLVLRIALAVVFFYFGTSQLRHPEAFIGWLPPEVSLIPLSGRTIVILNGAFETFFSLLLVVGLFTRFSALMLGGHLAGITLTIGWTEIGVRDFGLAAATIVIVLLGAGPLSMDEFFNPSRNDRGRSLREGLDTTNQTDNQNNQKYA